MALTTQPSAPRPNGYDARPDLRPRMTGPHPAASALPLFISAVVGIIATVWVALHTSFGQRYDQTALQVLDGGDSAVNDRLVRLLEQVSIGSAGVALAIMIGVALVRGRFRVAIAAASLVIGANVTTQLLKDNLLARPDLGVGTFANTLPSGHTTVVFSLVLAGVLVSPRALRGLVTFLGAAIGGLTGLATVIAGWHRPSDVVAGLLVTLAWAALVSAVLAGRSRDGIRSYGGSFAALLGGALAAFGVIIYGFGWTDSPENSRVIPFTAAVISAVAAGCVGSYASLVSRTSN